MIFSRSFTCNITLLISIFFSKITQIQQIHYSNNFILNKVQINKLPAFMAEHFKLLVFICCLGFNYQVFLKNALEAVYNIAPFDLSN